MDTKKPTRRQSSPGKQFRGPLFVLLIGFALGVTTILLLLSYSGLGVRLQGLPQLTTNQSIIEDTRSTQLNYDDVEGMFSYVFANLADEVIVYPTENYYYFKLFDGGHEIWGNIRLDAVDRQDGILSFAYFTTVNRREAPLDVRADQRHKNFTTDDGLVLSELEPLTYEVRYQGKTVIFHLNDVPQTLPDDLELLASEQFLYRIFDESGWQLVLLVDQDAPGFRFVLDPLAAQPDTLRQLNDSLLVGQHSGFIFYNDEERQRLVLVGVDALNTRKNNYYDGPFDQLADNFVTDDRLKDALLTVFPQYEGKVTARGVFLDDDGNTRNSRVAL